MTAGRMMWRVICRKESGLLLITCSPCPANAVTVYERAGMFALEAVMGQCCEYDDDFNELCPDFKPGAPWAENAPAVERLRAAIAGRFDDMERKEAAI